MVNSVMLCRLKIVINNHTVRRYSFKKHLDYSRVPVLDEKDLVEQQIKGSGPGGSKINTTASCIFLKHIPTGIVVKCQDSRSGAQNRKLARTHLLKKLDNHINGEDSLEGQIKRLQDKRTQSNEARKEKLRLLKAKWKELQEKD